MDSGLEIGRVWRDFWDARIGLCGFSEDFDEEFVEVKGGE